MENRFEKFTNLVLKTGKIIQRIKNIEMEEYGLKAVHVMCIYQLSKSTEGLTNKELVKLTYEDKAAISRALDLLKEKEIISSEPKKYNGIITLTEYGNKIADYICEKSDEALEKSGVGVTDKERKALYATLTKIENNIEEYYNDLSKKVIKE